jgi:hypothetical protein
MWYNIKNSNWSNCLYVYYVQWEWSQAILNQVNINVTCCDLKPYCSAFMPKLLTLPLTHPFCSTVYKE